MMLEIEGERERSTVGEFISRLENVVLGTLYKDTCSFSVLCLYDLFIY